MDNISEEKSKSKLGFISTGLFLLNVFLVVLFLIGQFLVMEIQSVGMLFIFFTPLIAVIGVIIGLIALFTRRAWIGLILNLLFIGFICVILWMTSSCCVPPPY